MHIAEQIAEAIERAWPDPMGQWTADQADAAAAMKRQAVKIARLRVRRGPAAGGYGLGRRDRDQRAGREALTMAHLAERIVEAIQAERLVDNTGDPSDLGYNEGIQAALAAVHEVASAPEPLRELAEWLVSLADDLGTEDPAAGLPTLEQVITRAREALGRNEG